MSKKQNFPHSHALNPSVSNYFVPSCRCWPCGGLVNRRVVCWNAFCRISNHVIACGCRNANTAVLRPQRFSTSAIINLIEQVYASLTKEIWRYNNTCMGMPTSRTCPNEIIAKANSIWTTVRSDSYNNEKNYKNDNKNDNKNNENTKNTKTANANTNDNNNLKGAYPLLQAKGQPPTWSVQTSIAGILFARSCVWFPNHN